MAIDLLLMMSGTGGDLVLHGDDLATTTGYENQPILAQFGGDGSWWGNALLDPPVEIQFSSKTEQALKDNVLNSAGLQNIENAMLADLQYLQDDITGTTVTVNCTIAAANRLDALITINGQKFFYQWSPNSGFLKYQI